MNEGVVDYAVNAVREGPDETVHEKAFQLMRLLAANHAFVDGNKRTALAATATFYYLNSYEFDYGNEVKEILKQLATDEAQVDRDETIEYFETLTTEADRDLREIVMWILSVLQRVDDEPGGFPALDADVATQKDNDYQNRDRKEDQDDGR